MTPQEAIDLVVLCGLNVRGNKESECISVIVSALEKQIPKKPTHEATLYKCFTCPNCKNVVDEFIDFRGEKTRVITPYCKFCGQNLDWGDKE